jgi:acetoin utilization deacetylase AcuC-like enzyme
MLRLCDAGGKASSRLANGAGVTKCGPMLPLVHHPHYHAALADNHALTINKFQRLAQILTAEGIVGPNGFHIPEPADEALLSAVHDADYVRQVLDLALPRDMQRRIGLPMSEEIVRRTRAVCGGTLLAARLALTHGIACNTAGGSHHAARDAGSGYCIFNDVAVASRALLNEEAVSQILVVDLDVHQGDGTALIFADEPRVFTFSMHAEKNFPTRKAISDLDIPLEDGLEDDAYLTVLRAALPGLLNRVKPDLVFYVAGVDPHRDDRLGRLALSSDGLAERDAFVLESCVARGAPIAGVLGGGYDRDTNRIAGRHATLHRAAHKAARPRP